MGVQEDMAWQAGNSRRGHWFTTHTVAVNLAMTKERPVSYTHLDVYKRQDKGRELKGQIADLKELAAAYREGTIKERVE